MEGDEEQIDTLAVKVKALHAQYPERCSCNQQTESCVVEECVYASAAELLSNCTASGVSLRSRLLAQFVSFWVSPAH